MSLKIVDINGYTLARKVRCPICDNLSFEDLKEPSPYDGFAYDSNDFWTSSLMCKKCKYVLKFKPSARFQKLAY